MGLIMSHIIRFYRVIHFKCKRSHTYWKLQQSVCLLVFFPYNPFIQHNVMQTYSLMQRILCCVDKLINSISLYRNGSRGMIGCCTGSLSNAPLPSVASFSFSSSVPVFFAVFSVIVCLTSVVDEANGRSLERILWNCCIDLFLLYILE